MSENDDEGRGQHPPETLNALFTNWLGAKMQLARERNTKGYHAYKKAHDSVKNTPLDIRHPSEAQMLDGIGEKTVNELTKKLREHYESRNWPMPKAPKGKKRAKVTGDTNGDGEEGSPSPAKKRKATVKAYVPKHRSGPYALLIALGKLGEDNMTGLTKHELCERAQSYCDSSFTQADHANGHYTAWSSMKTLTSKNLVYIQSQRGKRYLLTPEGWESAESLLKADPTQGQSTLFVARQGDALGLSNAGRSSSTPPGSPQASASVRRHEAADVVPRGNDTTIPDFEAWDIPADAFEVRLVLDNREVFGKNNRDFYEEELTKLGVVPLVRALEVGDIQWVAKLKNPDHLLNIGESDDVGPKRCDEITLDWIIERKRLDDLISSIKSGHFNEQKFRLRKMGVKNVIVLVEEFGMKDNGYQQMVQSAMAILQVVDGFFLQKTKSPKETAVYLAKMTKLLKTMYEGRNKPPLKLIPKQVITVQNYLPLVKHLRTTKPDSNYYITYEVFASLASKSDTLTLRDVFLRMLMCTKGVTGTKAIEIQKRWRTPIDFVEAFERCGDGEAGKKKKMALVSGEMGGLIPKKKIAKALSVKISEVWGEVDSTGT